MIPHPRLLRSSFAALFVALGLSGCAAPPKPVESRPVPSAASAPVLPAPAAPQPANSVPDVVPAPATDVATPTKPPHIALLLPTRAPLFQRAASAVQQGFMAGYLLETDPRLEVRLYTTLDSSDDVIANYRAAVEAGAVAVVGPLTRNSVTALAQSDRVGVPTLALNLPDTNVPAQPLLYYFPLATESEARQIARRMASLGKRNAATIVAANALARRNQAAFHDEWLKLGGAISAELSYAAEPAKLAALREQLQKAAPDALFLALDAQQARLVRPYIEPSVAVFATSLVHAEKPGPQRYLDLEGVRFFDMPWLLDRTRSDLARYPREEGNYTYEMRRLYAFGIDAAKLIQKIIVAPTSVNQPIAGATGELKLDAERQFVRIPLEAQFISGEVVLIESTP